MQDQFTIESVSSITLIPSDDWNRLANPAGASFDPFLCYDFFLALEESGSAIPETGWGPAHLIVSNEALEICGIMPLYLKGHSQGEYVFDHSWAEGFEMIGGSYYPKLLSAVPFTPVTGRRIFTAKKNSLAVQSLLIEAALTLVQQRQLSSFHINFIEPELALKLGEKDFLIRKNTQFHWVDQDYGDFDGFLASLQSRKRKVLKKERRTALEAGMEIKWIEGDDIRSDHWDDFYEFYIDTGAKKWGTPYLTRTFFDMISETLSEHIVLMFAYNEGRAIAGTLNLKGSDTLYGRYWGAREYHPCLHFELCYYQAIDYALARGLKRVEAGAQGEHKLLRGYAPTSTYSAHYIDHPRFKAAVADFLHSEDQSVTIRSEIMNEHLPYKNDETK